MCGASTDTLSASTVYVRCRDGQTLDTLSASTGYVWFRDSQHSTRSQPPQGMCGVETANTRYALSLHRVCVVPRQTNTRHALSLHRVCEVSRQPTLDTLSASTGYVRCRDPPPPKSRHALIIHRVCAVPPQTNTRHALSLHRVCAVPRQPTLDTLSASTGYVRCRDSQHSTRSQPPQGMCGAETANTRHALSLHRVCAVPRQPTLDTLSASTGYVRCRDSQHSTRSQPPQGMCGAETANTRHALSLHRVCVVPRQPTLATPSASSGYVWFRDSQHSICSQPPQGMCGS